MSEMRSMLVDTVTKMMKDLCSKELITAAEKGVWPERLWNTLEELGVTTVGINEEKGGSGGDLGDAMALLKVAGTYSAPIPLAESVLANWFLTSSGLPLVIGPTTFAPVVKSDLVEFKESLEGWVISGQARFVPWARNVNKIVVIGYTPKNKIMITAVDRYNCVINPLENLAGEPRDEVIFNNIEMKKENVSELSPDLDLDSIWNKGALTRIVLMTGALEKTLDLSVKYTKERTQFGRPIGKFQAIQQQLALLAGEITASMVVSDFIITNIDKDISTEEVAMAKIQLGEAAGLANKIAHQVHGAMGFTDEYPLHHSSRRLWSWRDEFGTESELANFLGETILKKGYKDFWLFITSNK